MFLVCFCFFKLFKVFCTGFKWITTRLSLNFQTCWIVEFCISSKSYSKWLHNVFAYKTTFLEISKMTRQYIFFSLNRCCILGIKANFSKSHQNYDKQSYVPRKKQSLYFVCFACMPINNPEETDWFYFTIK